MKSKISLIIALVLLAALVVPVHAAVYPTFAILSMAEDASVTIQTANFPANDTFCVRMGYYGTLAVDGILVSKITTGSGGMFKAKFFIPDELKGEEMIAIRLESPDSGYYSYNYFYNSNATYTSSGSSSSSSSSGSSLPDDFMTFRIVSVVARETVSVETVYFPEDELFAVYMKDGNTGIKTWYWVAGINSAEGGSFTMTLPIPSELKWKEKIAIKFYSLDTKMITYNLFNNQDSP